MLTFLQLKTDFFKLGKDADKDKKYADNDDTL
jgi:hypothetical protein